MFQNILRQEKERNLSIEKTRELCVTRKEASAARLG